MMYNNYNDGMAHDHLQRRQQGVGIPGAPAPDHTAYDADGKNPFLFPSKRTLYSV